MKERGVLQRQLRQLSRVGTQIVQLYPLLAVSGAMVLGILFWGGFNWSMEVTNTERFCVSCHVMRDNVYKEYKKTVHFENRTGVRATCPDCHVPKEWGHKVVRKLRATNELFHWLKGSINTREKFETKRLELAQHVWTGMSSTNSRECRNCHAIEFMSTELQTERAKVTHQLAQLWNQTCIDCHKGVAHSLPKGFNNSAAMDAMHERIEEEKMECRICHKDMAGNKSKDDW